MLSNYNEIKELLEYLGKEMNNFDKKKKRIGREIWDNEKDEILLNIIK